MSIRRCYSPESIVFITQVTYSRTPAFADSTLITLFRTILRNVKELHPFRMMAYVFLWDHMHLLLQPIGETTISQIMHSLKSNFTYQYKRHMGISHQTQFWQRRFYDHIIRDEKDFQKHMDYIHYNPVKHGFVTKPEDWNQSSFLEWKKRGWYADEWGWKEE